MSKPKLADHIFCAGRKCRVSRLDDSECGLPLSIHPPSLSKPKKVKVCVWEPLEKSRMWFHAGCNRRLYDAILTEDRWRFCPACGNKIKVAEAPTTGV